MNDTQTQEQLFGIVTVDELAQRWNLSIFDQSPRRYYGMHPFDPDAVARGYQNFHLYRDGTAYDYTLHKEYTAWDIAEAAGIDPKDYEPLIPIPASPVVMARQLEGLRAELDSLQKDGTGPDAKISFSFELTKLVRDRIPQLAEANGDQLKWYRYEDNESFKNALADKLVEEAQEVAKALRSGTREQLIEELADLSEVRMALARQAEIWGNEIEACRYSKEQSHGGFEKRICLVENLS